MGPSPVLHAARPCLRDVRRAPDGGTGSLTTRMRRRRKAMHKVCGRAGPCADIGVCALRVRRCACVAWNRSCTRARARARGFTDSVPGAFGGGRFTLSLTRRGGSQWGGTQVGANKRGLATRVRGLLSLGAPLFYALAREHDVRSTGHYQCPSHRPLWTRAERADPGAVVPPPPP